MPVAVENAFLFTDIEGSTRLWERDAHTMRLALECHDGILAHVMAAHDGHIFKTIGDAFCVAFDDASDALHAALDAQRELLVAERNGTVPPLRVRMAIHAGEAEEKDGDFFGPALSRVNRLLDAGHGGQILVSSAAKASLDGTLPEGVEMRDLGERRLKDLPGSERIFQIAAADLPSTFPPIRTLDPRAGNLPAWPTPFIGRESEVAEVSRRVREEARLLTLTGPGGTGKTRLALRAAESLVDEFEDGVFFVPLASIADHRLVASSIAKALGLAESGDLTPSDRVKAYLRGKEALLVLDNFEHLTGAAILISELLSECPKLKVLATSRSLLHLYGEQEHPVPPLSLPGDGGSRSIENLSGCESVRLFEERARAVRAGFRLDEGNAEAVAGICRRLDGLPLAIELAAARGRLLSPSDILARLDRMPDSGARDIPERHRSIRKAIGWSHAMLDDAEQTLFRRLGVFAGGFTLDSAATVCDGEASGDTHILVESLLDKSLIRIPEENDGAGENGGPRFSMLRTVREYAIECLEESGESEAVKRAHAECFLELAERGEAELKGPRQTEWMDRLETEHDNLRAALAWSLESDGETPLRISGSLGHFWSMRGHITEGRSWLEEALAKGVHAPATLRAKALNGAGILAMDHGDLVRAAPLLEEGLALSREAGYAEGVACALSDLSLTASHGGDSPRAEALAEEALALYREIGDTWGITNSLIALAYAKNCLGDRESAMELLEESLALSRETGEKQSVAIALNNLGYVSLLHGEPERAAVYLEECLALSRELGVGGVYTVSMCNLGWACLIRGEHEKAENLLKESLILSREMEDKIAIAECLEGLAGVAGVIGATGAAARLWGAAEALREETAPLSPDEKSLREPYLEAARSTLPETAWAGAWEKGRNMTLEEAVAFALEGRADARTA